MKKSNKKNKRNKRQYGTGLQTSGEPIEIERTYNVGGNIMTFKRQNITKIENLKLNNN